MKRYLKWLTAVLPIIIASCSQNECIDFVSEQSSPSNNRSIADIKEYAAQFAKLGQAGASRSDVPAVKEIIPLIRQLSRSSNDTLAYIVNYADEEGFLIVSAPKAAPSVLAYGDKGNIDLEEAAKNTNFQFALNSALNYVADCKSMSETSLPPIVLDTTTMVRTEYLTYKESTEPRVPMQWGQAWPENEYCPNKIAGCVPVAMAHTLAYLRPELELNLTFENSPKETINIDWETILTHNRSSSIRIPDEIDIHRHSNYCLADAEIHTQVGLFVRQLGEICDAFYLQNSTAAVTWYAVTQIEKMLRWKKFKRYKENYLYDIMKDEGVMILHGESASGAHAWVADGVGLIREITITHYVKFPSGEPEYNEMSWQDYHYIHHNWGWAGNQDGYFLDGIFDTNQGCTEFQSIRSKTDYSTDIVGYYIDNKPYNTL